MMEIHAMLDRDAQRAAWRVLGVAADASVKEAKRAFLALAKQHHPHVYARYKDPQINEAATRLFIMHKKAYSAFCKEAARKAASDRMVIDTPETKSKGDKGDAKPSTQHTARLWNERRGKVDG